MSVSSAGDIVQTYKTVFLRGLATVLPTLLTLWVIYACWQFVSQTVARPIADGIKTQLVETQAGNEVAFYVWGNLSFLRKAHPAPPPNDLDEAGAARWEQAERSRIEAAEVRRQADLREEIDRRFPRWVGVVLAVVVCFLFGFFSASFLGSSLWRLAESWAVRIPLVKNVYPGAKQMVNFFLAKDEASSFQAVVAVAFPREGLWSIGFLTSDNIPEIEAEAGERVRGVYLGTPAAGQVVLARESEIVAVDMTVDEALKFLMSGGVIGRDPARPHQPPGLLWNGASGSPAEASPEAEPEPPAEAEGTRD